MNKDEIKASIHSGPIIFEKPLDTIKYLPSIRNPVEFLLGHFDLSDELMTMLQELPVEFRGKGNVFFVRPGRTFRMEVKGGWLLLLVFLMPGEEMEENERYAYASLTQSGNCQVWVFRAHPPVWVEKVWCFRNGKEAEARDCNNRKLKKAYAKWYKGLKQGQAPFMEPDLNPWRYIAVLPLNPISHPIDRWKWDTPLMFGDVFGQGIYPSDVDAGFIVSGETGGKLLVIEAKEYGKALNTATWRTWNSYLRHNAGILMYVQKDLWGEAGKYRVYEEDQGNLVDCNNDEFIQAVREALGRMVGMDKEKRLFHAVIKEGLNLNN